MITSQGPYEVQVSVKDPDGSEAMCVEVQFTMLPPTPAPSSSASVETEEANAESELIARQIEDLQWAFKNQLGAREKEKEVGARGEGMVGAGGRKTRTAAGTWTRIRPAA